jgi:hypothetical protein
MTADIYVLYSPRDGRVRYVGESGDRMLRFKEHLRSAENSPGGCPVSKWFHQEWRRGYQVRYARLEVCDFDDRKQIETKWIRQFPRDDLLNQRKKSPLYLRIGSTDWPLQYKPPKPPRIAEIDSHMRRYIFNVEGFLGVHYERDSGYYRVLVYNGRLAPHWLEDKLADGQWFSDLSRALSARDSEQHRYRALMKQRCDADVLAARRRERDRIARGDSEDWTEGMPTPVAEGTLQAIGGKLYYPAPQSDPLHMRDR